MRYKLYLILFLLISCDKEENMLFQSMLSGNEEVIPKIKVLLLTGQSNSRGFALNSSAISGELAEQSNIDVYQHLTDKFDKLDISADNNYSSGSTVHGLELGLSQYLGEDVYLIKFGVNSSEIDRHLVGGDAYNNFKNLFIDPAIVLLDSMGMDYELIMCWWQGEEDALILQDANAYSAKFDTWVSLWQTNLGTDLKFRILEINAIARTNSQIINDVFAAKALTEANMEVIATKDLGNDLHFTYSNMKIASQLLLDTL